MLTNVMNRGKRNNFRVLKLEHMQRLHTKGEEIDRLREDKTSKIDSEHMITRIMPQCISRREDYALLPIESGDQPGGSFKEGLSLCKSPLGGPSSPAVSSSSTKLRLSKCNRLRTVDEKLPVWIPHLVSVLFVNIKKGSSKEYQHSSVWGIEHGPSLPKWPICGLVPGENAFSCHNCHPSSVSEEIHDSVLHSLLRKYSYMRNETNSDRGQDQLIDFQS